MGRGESHVTSTSSAQLLLGAGSAKQPGLKLGRQTRCPSGSTQSQCGEVPPALRLLLTLVPCGSLWFGGAAGKDTGGKIGKGW